jgi:hypothetical protein
VKPLNLKMMGRFGNMAMQYLAARSLAELCGLELRVPRWPGERIFQIKPTSEPDYSGEYVGGYFQNQESAIYTTSNVRAWFRFQPWVEQAFGHLKPKPEQIVAHFRAGDFSGYGYPVVSLQSYYNACEKFNMDSDAMCFVSDEFPSVVEGVEPDLQFVADFYIMCRAATLLRANSTFSWLAGVLNIGRVFSPRIDGLRGGEQDAEFEGGNHCRLANLEGFTDIHLKP